MKVRARPMQVMLTRAGIGLMRLLAPLPLPLLRSLGWLLGWLLYALAGSRRHVVKTNLALCFPSRPAAWRQRMAYQTFVYFAQAWLDRSWLWHGSEALLRRRLSLGGDPQQLQGLKPTVIFSPHFVGLDAGWTALTLQLPRQFTTIYTDQANKTVDAWILAGRRRFGGAHAPRQQRQEQQLGQTAVHKRIQSGWQLNVGAASDSSLRAARINLAFAADVRNLTASHHE